MHWLVLLLLLLGRRRNSAVVAVAAAVVAIVAAPMAVVAAGVVACGPFHFPVRCRDTGVDNPTVVEADADRTDRGRRARKTRAKTRPK